MSVKTSVMGNQRKTATSGSQGVAVWVAVGVSDWYYFFLAGAFAALAGALAGFAVRSLRAFPGVNLPFVLAAIFSGLPVMFSILIDLVRDVFRDAYHGRNHILPRKVPVRGLKSQNPTGRRQVEE
jgi:hypothetical protein